MGGGEKWSFGHFWQYGHHHQLLAFHIHEHMELGGGSGGSGGRGGAGKQRQGDLCKSKASLVYRGMTVQPGLHREALPQKKAKQKTKRKGLRSRVAAVL